MAANTSTVLVEEVVNAPFLPFSTPDIGEEEIAEVVDALRAGWITTGPRARQFESQFAEFIGHETCAVAVNSATAALHLALEALGLGPGDEVIVPTHTFTATAEVIRYLGADPVFVDVDPATLNLDPRLASAAVTPRTRAIIPVHFAGLPCRMDEIIALAKRCRLRVVEDAAHAFPAYHRGRMIGALDTDVTVFSFYATKTITTGEGGMLVTRDPDIVRRSQVMRLHGIDRDAFDRYSSTTPSWYYEVVAPGFKYNLTDVAAAIGIQQLKKATRFRDRRARLAARYTEELAGLPIALPPGADDLRSHAWHLYVVQLEADAPMSRNEFLEEMSRAGIGCSVHFIPLQFQPYWRDRYHLAPDAFPVSSAAASRVVSLPLYTRMSDDDQTRVIGAVRRLLG